MASVNRREKRVGEKGVFPELLRWLGRVIVSISLLGWMGLIFYLSSLEAEAVPGTFSRLGWLRDVVAHAGLYAVLGGLALLTLWAWLATAHRGFLWAAVAMAFGLLHGVFDEAHQSFVPGRSPSPADVLVDSLGATAGALAVWVAAWHGRRNTTPANRSLSKR